MLDVSLFLTSHTSSVNKSCLYTFSMFQNNMRLSSSPTSSQVQLSSPLVSTMAMISKPSPCPFLAFYNQLFLSPGLRLHQAFSVFPLLTSPGVHRVTTTRLSTVFRAHACRPGFPRSRWRRRPGPCLLLLTVRSPVGRVTRVWL